jgi:anti-sigma B factor antagonist
MGTPPAEGGPGHGPGQRLGEISRAEQDGVYVVAVTGELDISNVAELREAAMQIPNQALGLVVDLSAAGFIDSATVGLLFELRQALERRSQGLRVVCPPGSPAARALELMSFDAPAREAAGAAEAVAAIRRELAPRT